MDTITKMLLRVGHAPLRDRYKGFNLAHLLVLARMAASAGEWLNTNTVAVSTLSSVRHARELLGELTAWNLLEAREINRRNDHEFTLNNREIQLLHLHLFCRSRTEGSAEQD